MALPFFYINDYVPSRKEFHLDEVTSRHIVQVLRMKVGEKLNLTDGKGNLLETEIINDHKRHCEVKIINSKFTFRDSRHITIAISLLKNASRFEWFIEKATEIGVSEIIPLICERTEKEKFRYERLRGISTSAMLQSQQVWLPVIHDQRNLKEFINQHKTEQKFIAYCDNSADRLNLSTIKLLNSATILIGPEGDFTSEEIKLALEKDFRPISLGETRLRSETAGIVALTLAKNG